MLLSLYGLVWIFRNPCHGAFGRLTLKNLFFLHECLFKHEYGQWNSVMNIFGRMPPFWLSLSNSACGLCKWLVYVASLLAPMPNLLLFFVLIGLDNIVKTLPRCYLQTCWKTCFFPAKKKKHRQQQHPIPFDAVAMKATASIIREKITQDLRCLQLVFACSGPNQARNLTNIFCMNVLSDMNKGSGIQLCVFLVGCHPSDSHLAIQPVNDCKWLVYVASLLAPKPHLSMWCIWSRY